MDRKTVGDNESSMLNVYIARVKSVDINEIYPYSRREEINSCKSEKVKLEKASAWKLLEYAVLKNFGRNIKDIPIAKRKDGKWTSPNFYFSLSHSNGVVAVAVSRSLVGVDVELIDEKRAGVLEKVLTKSEKIQLNDVEDCEKLYSLTAKWAEKESLFKAESEKSFRPHKIETNGKNVTSQRITLGEKEFVLSVCSEVLSSFKLYENVDF